MKKKELQNFKIARFALNTSFEQIGEENIELLKRHLLDAIGSFIFSKQQTTPQKLIAQIREMGEGGQCKAPQLNGLSYDRAAQLYTALIRYPDFMDNFLGKEATCHPSDNIGSLLAAAQYKHTTGKDFLAAMAIAYQIECRLVLEIPVMKEGIDHTLLLGYSITAAVARLIGLTEDETAHALGITGTSISPMVTSRAAYTFEWKGLASSLDALNCMGIVFMAKHKITGPIAIFEGPKGFDEVFGMKLNYNWDNENFSLIKKCVLKEYNAEVHSQSTLEAVNEIMQKHSFAIEDIDRIDITTFFTAYHIIGSGAYGDRKIVFSKEQADHSLFYLTAVLLLDGNVYPEQFAPDRIMQADVQALLKKVFVHTKFPIHKPVLLTGALDPYTQRYPEKVMAKVEISLRNGEKLSCVKEDFHGFHTRPFSWNDTINKFKRLTAKAVSNEMSEKIISTIQHLESEPNMSHLIELITS